MSEIIYVVVRKDNNSIVRGSGPRKLLAYTSEGRAKSAMKAQRLSEEFFKVVEFTQNKGVD